MHHSALDGFFIQFKDKLTCCLLSVYFTHSVKHTSNCYSRNEYSSQKNDVRLKKRADQRRVLGHLVRNRHLPGGSEK